MHRRPFLHRVHRRRHKTARGIGPEDPPLLLEEAARVHRNEGGLDPSSSVRRGRRSHQDQVAPRGRRPSSSNNHAPTIPGLPDTSGPSGIEVTHTRRSSSRGLRRIDTSNGTHPLRDGPLGVKAATGNGGPRREYQGLHGGLAASPVSGQSSQERSVVNDDGLRPRRSRKRFPGPFILASFLVRSEFATLPSGTRSTLRRLQAPRWAGASFTSRRAPRALAIR